MNATPQQSPPVSNGEQNVEVDDLAAKLVAFVRLRSPRVHRALAVTLGVLAVVCLLATVTRASAAPLLPLAGLAVAGVAAWRVRTAATDRQLLVQVTVFGCAVAVALWSMSFVARNLV
ncbi:hypothetical protein [Saccharomonospora azurea]|uniref:hypothetical protein n=1 Tax=Saccharomonospora azurea TaxID=40988 RepID=UPI003D8B899F